ncbi:MAG: tetratricopeptide repeat protein [Bryobacteraceae bacterium]|jgi:TolA-binding protein
MKLMRVLLIGALALPVASAASKEIVELQRDVALLQEQVRTLQSSQDQKIASLQTLMQQTLDTVNRLNTSVALLGNSIETNANKTTPAVAGLNGRLDQVAQSFNDLRDNVQDISARIGKLDAAIADLKNTVNLAAHPAPPPAGANVNPEAQQAGAPASGPPAGMSAEQSYSNAVRDYKGGQFDLALQEFQDYLQYFPTTQFAPNAQFYIGDILYRKGSYEKAVAAFDAVNEKYQDNLKTADAHYMKGLALIKMGRRDAAAKEFRVVIARSSDSELVARAKKQLQDLGLSPARKTRR